MSWLLHLICSVLLTAIVDAVVGTIPYNGITEISGEAGSGKTQLCLSIALKVCHNSLIGFLLSQLTQL